MPSPFPGMDPYLEHPEFFPDFHDRFITELNNELQPRLPPAYFAITGSRVWVEYSERILEPDLGVVRSPDRPTSAGNGAATAVVVSIRPVVVQVPNDETRETYLEIHTVQGERRLVTMLEVLSPSNKTSGKEGRDLYLKKQRQVLSSKAHLLEIDLLRGGMHTTAVPRDAAVAVTGPFHYHVCLRRFYELGRFYVYPIRLDERLPQIEVPLLPGDSPVTVDLQAVFARCYDNGPYRHLSPYTAHPPDPPLSAEQATWANELLRSKGLLPTA